MTLILIASLVIASGALPPDQGGDGVRAESAPNRARATSWRLGLLLRYGPVAPRAAPVGRQEHSAASSARSVPVPVRETALDPPPLNVSSPRDPWLAYDKLQHVTFGLLGTLSAQYVLTEKAGASASTALGLSTGTAAAASVGKELYDRRDGRFFSFRDLVADTLGIGLAAGIIVL